MFCGKCGAKVSADMKFCNKCGAPVEAEDMTPNDKKTHKEKKKSHSLAKFIFILILLLCIPAAYFAGMLKT